MPDMIAEHYLRVPGEKVRQGGQALVYKCLDIRTMSTVAVKIVQGLFTDDMGRRIFKREVGLLSKLHHPGIVKYHDSGYNESDGLFIVLDWVEESLETRLERDHPLPWDSAVAGILRPLAQTLKYIHLSDREHRDIKPGNVLIDANDSPMFADFGIGKSRDSSDATTNTVQQFVSGVWAPPEKAGPAYVRDVYSLALLYVDAVTPNRITEFHQIAPAIRALRIPDSLRSLLDRATNIDPGVRPANGAVFCDELEALIKAGRPTARELKVRIELTPSAISVLSPGLPDRYSAARRLEEDLSQSCYVDYWWDTDNDTYDRSTLVISGASFKAVLRIGSSGELKVHALTKPEYEELERFRTRGYRIQQGVALTKDLREGREGSARLIERLDRFLESKDADIDPKHVESIIGVWRRLLTAREEVARKGLSPLRYKKVTSDRFRATFELSDSADDELLGTEWQVKRPGANGWLARGEIVNVAERAVTLRLPTAAKKLPRSGTLEPHLGAAQAALQRQTDALSALELRTTAREGLHELLSDPTTAEAVTPVTVESWNLELDHDKMAAVEGALGAPSCVLLQGPPGTGKTRFIAELVLQELRRDPTVRILIVGQTHNAVDNALERLDVASSVKMIRLGNEHESKISPASRKLMLNGQVASWASDVRVKAERALEQRASQHGVSIETLRALTALSELRAVRKSLAYLLRRMNQTEEAGPLTTDLGYEEEALTVAERIDTLRDSEKDLLDRMVGMKLGGIVVAELEAIDDIDAAIDLLREGSDHIPHLLEELKLQSEWLARIETDPNIAAEILRAASVVAGTCVGFVGNSHVRDIEFDLCIVDEASKATSTEALVPIVRSKRFVLVGDLNQLPPMDEDLLASAEILDQNDLSVENVEETLFKRLAELLPASNQFQLTQQYRMIKPIGDMISTCFYEGALQSPNTDGLTGYDLFGKPLLWLDTSAAGDKRFEDVDQGTPGRYVNRREADIILGRVRALEALVSRDVLSVPESGPLHVLVLAPYRSQVEHLRRRLAAISTKYLQVSVDTVDAVQGREADIVFFSVTRSNARRSYGFLGREYWRRINVALSRGRFGLTVVGDMRFCEKGALGPVVAYFRQHPDSAEVRVGDV